jgi:hypothetical protein
MRRALRVAAAAIMLCLSVAGCGGGGSAATSTPPPPSCMDLRRPETPLVVELRQQPTATDAACLGQVYDNIVAPAWNDLPREVHAIDPNDRLWQTWSLQYGFVPCADCPRPALDPATVRDDHPEWILTDAEGQDVHPPGHPGWIMYDISNPDYLAAWAASVVDQLTKNAGWEGVFVVDAGNRQAWQTPPIDPATKQPMTFQDHARYLASAMAEARSGLKVNGFLMVADNAPSNLVDADQIGSADAVSVGRGFARLSGADWTQLYGYFERALDRRTSAWVWDGGKLTRSERIFGLASYLLISDALYSAYGVTSGAQQSLYNLNPGGPSEPAPVQQDGAYVRTFASGEVAVNPGPLAASLQVPGRDQPVTVPPNAAFILANGRLTTSFP